MYDIMLIAFALTALGMAALMGAYIRQNRDTRLQPVAINSREYELKEDKLDRRQVR